MNSNCNYTGEYVSVCGTIQEVVDVDLSDNLLYYQDVDDGEIYRVTLDDVRRENSKEDLFRIEKLFGITI